MNTYVMKIVYCKIIPFKDFFATNFFTLIIVRKRYKERVERGGCIIKRMLNHENIHSEQMKETLFIGFYILYLLNWLFNLIVCPKHAYKYIVFEQEAYANQGNLDYIKHRKHYAWIKYLFKKPVK